MEPSAPDLDALLAAHLPALRAFVRLNIDSFLRQRESGSDLVQSVCQDLLRQRGRFDWQDERAFKNWLYTAVLNKIRDHERYWRTDKRAPAHEVRVSDVDELTRCYATVFSPSQHAIASERVELLERAFDALPPQYREMVTLSRVLGLSHSEIAERLDKSPANVRMLLSRALARLSSTMAELDRDASGHVRGERKER